MTYQQSLDFLYGLQKFGIKLGLENIRTFLSRLGHPEGRFKSVLVAGTNGKGSTASALAAMLARSGHRTGLYTSPHLHSFSERVRVNGEPIPDRRVAELVAEMRPPAGELPLTFFEFTTALALQFFAESEVEIAVLEVGLGGRLDATNAVKPLLSVLTPIARDHQRHLGEDLDAIAREKAGILRVGVPAVSAAQEPPAEKSLRDEAARLGTTIDFCGGEFRFADRGEIFDYLGLRTRLDGLRPGIPGRHQFVNMATALAAAEHLQQAGYDLPEAALRHGVETLFWPGRLEWLADGTVLLDGAHNGAGAESLAGYLRDRKVGGVHWIVGMKADKKCDELLAPLAAHTAEVYCVEPPVEEALPQAVLQAAAERIGLPARSCPSIAAALQQARRAAGGNGVVLVAGSLFLVAAVRELLLEEGRPCDNTGC